MRVLILAWLIQAMSLWVPIPKQFVGETSTAYALRVGETQEAAERRRQEIADAILTVAMDPAEKPLFPGPDGRLRTAIVMNAIASFEGGYHRLVHSGVWKGDCKDKPVPGGGTRPCTIAESTKEGNSWCMMQLNIGKGETQEGWTGPDLIGDPIKCFRSGLHALHTSVSACKAAPYSFTWEKDGPDIFSAYMGGKCVHGSEQAKNRIERAEAFFKTHSPPGDDKSVK